MKNFFAKTLIIKYFLIYSLFNDASGVKILLIGVNLIFLLTY